MTPIDNKTLAKAVCWELGADKAPKGGCEKLIEPRVSAHAQVCANAQDQAQCLATHIRSTAKKIAPLLTNSLHAQFVRFGILDTPRIGDHAENVLGGSLGILSPWLFREDTNSIPESRATHPFMKVIRVNPTCVLQINALTGSLTTQCEF